MAGPLEDRVYFSLLEEGAYRAISFPYRYPKDNPNVTTSREIELIELFRQSIAPFEKQAEEDDTVADSKEKAADFGRRYASVLQELKGNPKSHGWPLDSILLCKLRQQILRQAGFTDIYAKVRHDESTRAMSLYNYVIHHHCAIEDPARRLESLIRGIFAAGSVEIKDQISFKASIHAVPSRDSRGWVIDDFIKFKDKWIAMPWEKIVIFVDKAGADTILGILPFAREFVLNDKTVVLAANGEPSITDITHSELGGIISNEVITAELGENHHKLTVANSGNDLPVLDLNAVPQEFAALSGDADLVIFAGVGRAIETNLYAKFKCDSLKIARFCDSFRKRLGAKPDDCVFKYDLKQ